MNELFVHTLLSTIIRESADDMKHRKYPIAPTRNDMLRTDDLHPWTTSMSVSDSPRIMAIPLNQRAASQFLSTFNAEG